jgi:NAD(P) transhydrogenase subunit alpha
MQIGVPTEIAVGERRVALVPRNVRNLVQAGHEVLVQAGAGAGALVTDVAFHAAGAVVVEKRAEVLGADVVVAVAPPTPAEVAEMVRGAVLIGFLDPHRNPALIEALADAGVTGLAFEEVPREGAAQAMDALSSQAGVAGYRAVIRAAEAYRRLFEFQSTAAGVIPPAKVLVLGTAVAGLRAIVTARQLGADVWGFDVRDTKADVESAMGRFLALDLGGDSYDAKGGYARPLTREEQARLIELLQPRIPEFDIVIGTAALRRGRAPRLITGGAVRAMRPGSVIVDLAAQTGGNCELSRLGETIVVDGVTIVASPDLASEAAPVASQFYSANVAGLLALITGDDGQVRLDFDNDIIRAACVTRGRE